MRYRYKLEDYDTDWHYIAANTEVPHATYQKLPYGTYKLLVEVGDWQQWSGAQTELIVVSKPPFLAHVVGVFVVRNHFSFIAIYRISLLFAMDTNEAYHSCTRGKRTP